MRYNEKVQAEVVKYLIAQGCDIKNADKNKMTVLHYAMINNHNNSEEIKLLVDLDADVNAKMA